MSALELFLGSEIDEIDGLSGRPPNPPPPPTLLPLTFVCANRFPACASNLLLCFLTSSSFNFTLLAISRNASGFDGSMDAGGWRSVCRTESRSEVGVWRMKDLVQCRMARPTR